MDYLNEGGCMGRKGKPLRAHPDRDSADKAARHTTSTSGRAMVAYHCERCDAWHICPAHRHTPSHHCTPCDKQSYESEASAKRRAAILRNERGVTLHMYACPAGDGWHLTSHFNLYAPKPADPSQAPGDGRPGGAANRRQDGSGTSDKRCNANNDKT